MKKITPINNNGNILIRFSYQGKRYAFAPIKEGKYLNSWDLKRADAVCTQIMIDIELNQFDCSLSRYKQTGDTILLDKNPELKDLWKKYTDYKKPMLAPSTLDVDFKRRVEANLNKMPSTNLNDALIIRDWLLNNVSLKQSKKILIQLNACCNWAKKLNIISENPFAGMATDIKVTKKDEEEYINPFTAEERDRILEAFKSNSAYSHYYRLTAFLFYTGCRPCEALPLTWRDVSKDSICFNKSYVEGKNRSRLKTQKQRTIKINSQISSIIGHHNHPNDQLVFPSKNGGYIIWGNFVNRIWKKVLESLTEIEYRNPYQCRHTFITLALQKNVGLTDLARHCGNSPKMILSHYAGITRDFVMPDL
ncbi:integrase family protein [Gloeothece citriformis PCC 7424]|uniref:Integrase family protein n=1 Tax=Gloeothece citriformis (strain PCC 7424) TaxID=65393 RepID=B7K9D2_GLOC7|nr:tyrosine-type recombinase/integrase [Gloeothece citriformis]ACK68615.1 integrase family protein [Gloeothece citriformis PCC 7424]